MLGLDLLRPLGELDYPGRQVGANGILGLSGIGYRRVVFDFDRGSLLLGPLAAVLPRS